MDEETFFFETDEETFLNHMSKGAKTCYARKRSAEHIENRET
jgi:hypothetical protein